MREIAASKIPVITGIGHETDFTLCDFAADMRAPTPSAAAEISVPDIEELWQITDNLVFRYEKAVNSYLQNLTAVNDNLSLRLELLNPKKIIENRMNETLIYKDRLNSAVNNILSRQEANLKMLSEKLRLLNPLLMIEKGYIPAFVNEKRVIKAQEIHSGDEITLEFSDGKVHCDVKDIILSEN